VAERITIRNTQSPGDYVVLTGAIRDICKMYPGRFDFYTDTPQPAVFTANPYAKPVRAPGGIRTVVAKYPMIHKSNQRHLHFMWGFLEYLNEQLGTGAVLTELRPDLHLTPDEKLKPVIDKKPYWVFASGGKKDFTAKWWDPACWQRVADMLQGRFTLVQVGGGSHVHPPIRGVYDLVNKTSFRQLMQLIYHAEGVMCVVTCLMHIAAAFNKPCVCVSGGREPWWWEAYNQENRVANLKHGMPNWAVPVPDNYIPHQYLHTIGQLDCCKTGGCWKSRIEPFKSSCVMPVMQGAVRIPRCLQMITPEMVVQAVDWYYANGILSKDGSKQIIQLAEGPSLVTAETEPRFENLVPESVTIQAPAAMLDKAFSKLAGIANGQWFVWSSGETFAEGWQERVFTRLGRSNAAGGFVYRRGRNYYLKKRLIVLPSMLAKELGEPVNGDFETWLGQELQRRGCKLIDVGDLVLQ